MKQEMELNSFHLDVLQTHGAAPELVSTPNRRQSSEKLPSIVSASKLRHRITARGR